VSASSERKLQLSVKDGLVTLVAQNVTVRDIMTEWQRRTGCQFVNAEKLPSSLVTLDFPDRPELEVIGALLRDSAGTTPGSGYGYIVAPKREASDTESLCGAVYILPTSHPTTSASYVPTGSAPMAAPLITPGSPDDEIPPVTPVQAPGMPPQVQPRPGMPIPGQQQPAQQNPGTTQPPPVQGGGFGPVAPTAPGAGRIATPATPAPAPAPGNGRGQ
jgi:hypothetical protein